MKHSSETNNPNSLWGPSDDAYAGNARPRAQRQTRANTPRRREERSAPVKASQMAAAAPTSGTKPRPSDLHFRLADDFIAQPWVHAYRGDSKASAPLVLDTSRHLVAAILRERMSKEPRFEGRSEEKIEEVMGYAMKHFFDRVPNEERTGKVVNRFVSTDWWDTLLDEAIDHWTVTRMPETAYEEGRRAAEAFYADWPGKETREQPSAVQEAAERFREVLARHAANQPNYDDCEPLL